MSTVDELNAFMGARPHHDLSWCRERDRPIYSRTNLHGSGIQSKLLDTAGASQIANERRIRVALSNREIVPEEAPAPVETEVEDPARVSQRLAQVFGPRTELTQGCGATGDRRTGFNPSPTKAQLAAAEFEPYLPIGHKHRRTNYQYLSRSTAWRGEAGLSQVFCTTVAPHRHVDDANIDIAQAAEYHKMEPTGELNRDLYHNWVCPGRLGADCFNYYDHESASHPQEAASPELIHGHSGSGHPEAPGCANVGRVTTRHNRKCLMPPGANLVSHGLSPF